MIGEALLLACVLLGPLAFGCVEDWSASLLRAFLAALLLTARPRPQGRSPLLHRTFLPALLALMALGAAQLAHPGAAGEPRYSLLGTAAPWATRKALLHLACLAALLWRGPWLFAARENASRRFAWALVSVGAGVALIGLLQNSAGNQWVYGFREVRAGRVPFGPYFNHNHATTLMGMSLMAGIGLFASRLSGIWRRAALGEPISEFAAVQVILFGELAVLTLGIAASVSRGGYLAIGLSSIAVLVLLGTAAGPRRRTPWLFAALAAVLLVAGAILMNPRWAGLLRGALDRSASSRASLYRTSTDVFQDFPAFGVGLGAFQEIFPAYQRTEPGFLIDHLHSDWLELLLEAGGTGLLVYAGGLTLFLGGVVGAWRGLPRETLALSAGGMGAALVFMIHGLVDFPFHIPANGAVFFAVLAWLGHVSFEGTIAGGEEALPLPERSRRILVEGVLGVFLAAWALRPAAAALETHRALHADRLSGLQRAYGWDPDPARGHRLAVGLYQEATAGPAGDPVRLRQGLRLTTRGLALRPLNPDSRNLHAALLSELGRGDDAAPLVTFSYK